MKSGTAFMRLKCFVWQTSGAVRPQRQRCANYASRVGIMRYGREPGYRTDASPRDARQRAAKAARDAKRLARIERREARKAGDEASLWLVTVRVGQ